MKNRRKLKKTILSATKTKLHQMMLMKKNIWTKLTPIQIVVEKVRKKIPKKKIKAQIFLTTRVFTSTINQDPSTYALRLVRIFILKILKRSLFL